MLSPEAATELVGRVVMVKEQMVIGVIVGFTPVVRYGKDKDAMVFMVRGIQDISRVRYDKNGYETYWSCDIDDMILHRPYPLFRICHRLGGTGGEINFIENLEARAAEMKAPHTVYCLNPLLKLEKAQGDVFFETLCSSLRSEALAIQRARRRHNG